MLERVRIGLNAAVGMALVLSMPVLAQNSEMPAPETGTIMGTVTDANADTIPNATVVLKEVEGNDPRTIVTPGNGVFEFHDVQPGIPYQLSISAKDFGDWTSPAITLDPGQFKIVTGIQLRIETERTSVSFITILLRSPPTNSKPRKSSASSESSPTSTSPTTVIRRREH